MTDGANTRESVNWQSLILISEGIHKILYSLKYFSEATDNW